MNYLRTVIYLLLAYPSAIAGQCRDTAGLLGECTPADICRNLGGSPEAGFCGGNPGGNIECCTFPTCRPSSGRHGQCTFANVCSQSNGSFEGKAGCPGSSAIQCCSYCPGGDVSAATVDLIKGFEGFVASPKPGQTGHLTVGYGHLCQRPNCAEVPFSFPLDTTTATRLLANDLRNFEACLSDRIYNVKLNENQYGALVSWTFNIGCDQMASSTLATRLMEGQDPNLVASEEIPRWVRSDGQTLQDLVDRRRIEVAFFQRPSSVQALPGRC